MRPALVALLFTLCSASLLIAARVVFWPLVSVQLPAPNPRKRVVTTDTRAFTPQPSRIIERDPFRMSRKPSPIAYDPLRVGEQMEPPRPKPALSLLGLITGTEKTAVIRGLPGIEGPWVVREGDRIAGIVVKAISSNDIRLVGFDTTWVLRLAPQ